MSPRLFTATLVLLVWAGPAHAQPSTPAPEAARPAPALLLHGGYVAFADDGRIDHGAGGAGIEWQLRSHLALGAELSYMVGPGADRDLLIGAALRASVLRWDRPVVPYGLAVAGAMAHSDRLFGRSYSDIGMLLQVGGGVRVALWPRVFVAPEFAIGGPPHIRATVTVGVRLSEGRPGRELAHEAQGPP